MLGLDGCELVAYQGDGLVPLDLHERLAHALQGLGQPIGGVHVIPAKLALYTRRDTVCRTMLGFDLQDVPVARPDVEAAADTTVGAHGFSALHALVPHLGFHGGEGQNGRVAG